MPVHIKEIQAKALGPIDQFSFSPGLVNLIYGQNEKGKTHLVEFLIRSLFRQNRQWNLRKNTGHGKVTLSGIGDDLTFSPTTPEKLEDYLEKEMPGLPVDISKLLVVKGAETEIGDSPGGADKAILKKYLSSFRRQ